MVREIRKLLAGVRFRQRQVQCLEWLVRGAVFGAVLGLMFEIARSCGAPVSYSVCWWVFLAVTLVIGSIGWLLPIHWKSSARLVDDHYRLKDGALSALDFAGRKLVDPFMQLQIANTIRNLQAVDAKVVLPFQAPKLLPVALALCGLLLSLPFFPREQIDTPEIDAALQQVVNEQAQALDESMVEELRKLAERTEEPELKELVKELEKLVKSLKSPQIDQREALAKLSEMQQNLAKALNQFNTEKTDAELKEFASALESAESMQAIAEALKNGKYEKAAEQLEKMDASSMTRKEREAVAADLKKFRENLGAGKQGELSESAQDMQEGLEKENQSQLKDGASQAASVCEKQGLKKSISNSLNSQLNRLSESKSQFQGQFAGGLVKKSERDSNKIGKAASGKPLGEEATKIDSLRREENVTGLQGDGPSERETTQSPEGAQDAGRSYQARYTEFRRQMEEVLDSEPLPIGHRQTVRKYFESIRPANQDVAE